MISKRIPNLDVGGLFGQCGGVYLFGWPRNSIGHSTRMLCLHIDGYGRREKVLDII